MKKQSTYKVRAEMMVRGCVKIVASSKREAVQKVEAMLTMKDKHRALDAIQLTDKANSFVTFMVPISWCEIEKGPSGKTV